MTRRWRISHRAFAGARGIVLALAVLLLVLGYRRDESDLQRWYLRGFGGILLLVWLGISVVAVIVYLRRKCRVGSDGAK